MVDRPHLKPPFPSLSADNLISRGSAGHVFAIGKSIVLKCPTIFDDAGFDQVNEMKESIRKIENEKTIQDILIDNRHPSIVHAILCVPQGIFMERLMCTLHFRISQHAVRPINQNTRCRWIRQLTSAVAWLEGLGYAHGDLRPTNALLDSGDNVKLSDFDATVRFGEQLLVATEPFCRVDKNFDPPLATPATEQFALGGCIYTIQHCSQPFAELDPPSRVRKLQAGEFPSTSSDHAFGEVVQRCWNAAYHSTKELQKVIEFRILDHFENGEEQRMVSTLLSHQQSEALRLECQSFLQVG